MTNGSSRARPARPAQPAQGRPQQIRAAAELLDGMGQLTGDTITVATRVNVAGTSQFVSAALVVPLLLVIYAGVQRQPLAVLVGLVAGAVLRALAWPVLRSRRGPLGFGASGAVIAVSRTTLYVAAPKGWWTVRPVRVLGSWPRSDATVAQASPSAGRGRYVEVRLRGLEPVARLELVHIWDKDRTLPALGVRGE